MITYSQLMSLVKPYFLSRWWDDFASPERIMLYMNASIQDIYNLDGMVSRYFTEKIITYVDEWQFRKFVSTYPIDKLEETYNQDWNPLSPTLYIPKCNEVKFQWNNILASGDTEALSVTYIKQYIWKDWHTDFNAPIQLDDKYIPGLIKLIYDWASPINLMSGETSTFDFYSHAMNRINTINNNDALSNSYGINLAR